MISPSYNRPFVDPRLHLVTPVSKENQGKGKRNGRVKTEISMAAAEHDRVGIFNVIKVITQTT